MSDNKPTSLSEILSKFGVNYANIYNGDDVHSTFAEIKAEAIAAITALVPEKPSNELIQAALQNGRPQQAASYNGYASAINTIHRNFNGQTDTEREDSRI